MIKILCSLVFILSMPRQSEAQEPKFEVKFSEPLAVFVFLQNLSTHVADNPFKMAFSRSKYNDAHFQQLIEKFDSLHLVYSYEFSDYPFGARMPLLTDRLLKKNLIDAGSLSDFAFRTLGILPNTDLQGLTEILSAFTPVYRELIYGPNKAVFERQLAEIGNYVRTRDIGHYFEMGLTFYGSRWDNAIPFEICLYPLPDPHGFTAEAFFNNAVSAIPTNLKDYDLILGIMMHEVFHMIYNEQPLALKDRIYRWFTSDTSKGSTYAYELMNEAFATVLGNGYVYASLHGSPDTTQWYHQDYIDAAAHKLYPMVKNYIEGKRTIDSDFVRNYIRLCDPKWLSEMDNLLTYRFVISDSDRDFGEISANYPYASYSDFESPIDRANMEKMFGTPVTKVVIVSGDREKKFALIKSVFPELAHTAFHADREFTYHVMLKDKTQLIVINRIKTPTAALLKRVF